MEEKIKKNSFLSWNIGLVLFGPLLICINLFLAYLYDINAEILSYLIAFILSIEGALLGLQYYQYRKNTEVEPKEEQEKADLDELWNRQKQQEDFFALWTHQIKTPIAALNLLLRCEEIDVTACKGEVFKIESYAEMALGYIRYGEMRNDLELASCSLEMLVKQVVKKFAPLFISKHISVQLEGLDHQILTDEKWFSFVVEQLLSNAIKYTPKGGIRIYGKEQDEGFLFAIEDTGIGICAEDIPRIFEKGFTGYNGRMDKKASGLGLYLCKGICDKLGHRLQITSTQNVGTRVCVLMQKDRLNKSNLTKM